MQQEREKQVAYEKRSSVPEVYSGVPTFLGVPRIDAADIDRQDAVVIGVPWEGICTTGTYTGTELAPKSIRSVSLRYGGYLPEFGYDFFDRIEVGDFGDTPVFPGDIEKTFEAVEGKFSEVYGRGRSTVGFGGDHSITIPVIRALSKRYKKIGIVHFDAHMDNLAAFQGEEKNARCSPLYRAYEASAVASVVHIGIRGPRNHPSGLDNAKAHGAKVITAPEFHRRGWEDVAREVKESLAGKVDAVYITICSDVLDVSVNPGGPADFGGLTSHQLLQTVYEVSTLGFAAFDFVEVYPPQDPNGVSSHMAAWAAIYALSGFAAGAKKD